MASKKKSKSFNQGDLAKYHLDNDCFIELQQETKDVFKDETFLKHYDVQKHVYKNKDSYKPFDNKLCTIVKKFDTSIFTDSFDKKTDMYAIKFMSNPYIFYVCSESLK